MWILHHKLLMSAHISKCVFILPHPLEFHYEATQDATTTKRQEDNSTLQIFYFSNFLAAVYKMSLTTSGSRIQNTSGLSLFKAIPVRPSAVSAENLSTWGRCDVQLWTPIWRVYV